MKYLERFKEYSNYAFIAFVLFFVISLAGNISEIRNASSKIDEKQEKVAELEKKQEELKSSLKQAESEAFIEQQLRDNLGYAKEGEIVVVLPEEEILREIGKLKEVEQERLPDPNWVKWAKLFKIYL